MASLGSAGIAESVQAAAGVGLAESILPSGHIISITEILERNNVYERCFDLGSGL